MDSRIKELVDDISPTVSVKWHKGAADTPLVCEKYLFENHSQDSRYRGPLDVCPMLPAQLGTGGNNQPFVVEGVKSYDIGEARLRTPSEYDEVSPTLTARCGTGGNNTGTVPTLVAKGPAAVCEPSYIDTFHADDVVRIDDKVSALQARDYKGGKLVQVNYIVRRLTPTECARLQGFPDKWGHPDRKEDFTDEEYRFWCDVVLTKALIDGTVIYNDDGELYFAKQDKPYKPKTKEQLRTGTTNSTPTAPSTRCGATASPFPVTCM